MAIAVFTSFGQQSDSNGVPLNAGTIDVYSAGTTTPLSLYSDSGLSVSATNPITLDSSGRHAITYIATASYKVVCKNSAGTTIYTRDNIDPGVAVGSGALPIANGGTAGTTAAAARTNLGAASASDMATVQSDILNLTDWSGYGNTDNSNVATGTTAQRPVTPAAGMIRRNSTTGVFEAYGTGWTNLLTGDAASSAANLRSETAEDTFPRPDRIKHSPGVAKAWALVTVSGGTPAVTVSNNVTSVADNGVGDYTITFTNAFSSADFAVIATVFGTAAGTNGLVYSIRCSATTTTTARILIQAASTSGNANLAALDSSFAIMALGTLA
jgi:hypothetical protein